MEFVEFTDDLVNLIGEEEYRELQSHLIENPKVGDVIPKSGGVRKIRWAAKGKGKRGGVRVIYYFYVHKDTIYILDAYAKNEQEDLTPSQVKELAEIVRMLKA